MGPRALNSQKQTIRAPETTISSSPSTKKQRKIFGPLQWVLRAPTTHSRPSRSHHASPTRQHQRRVRQSRPTGHCNVAAILASPCHACRVADHIGLAPLPHAPTSNRQPPLPRLTPLIIMCLSPHFGELHGRIRGPGSEPENPKTLQKKLLQALFFMPICAKIIPTRPITPTTC